MSLLPGLSRAPFTSWAGIGTELGMQGRLGLRRAGPLPEHSGWVSAPSPPLPCKGA